MNKRSSRHQTVKHCQNCGVAVKEGQKLCVRCGFEVDRGNNYCERCGTLIDKNKDRCLNCHPSFGEYKTRVMEPPVIHKILTGVLVASIAFILIAFAPGLISRFVERNELISEQKDEDIPSVLGTEKHEEMTESQESSESTTKAELQTEAEVEPTTEEATESVTYATDAYSYDDYELDIFHDSDLLVSRQEGMMKIDYSVGFFHDGAYYSHEEQLNRFMDSYLLEYFEYLSGDENYLSEYCSEEFIEMKLNEFYYDSVLIECVLGRMTNNEEVVLVLVGEYYADLSTQHLLYQVDVNGSNYEISDVSLVDSTAVYSDETVHGISFIPYELVIEHGRYSANPSSAKSMNYAGLDYYYKGQLENAAAIFYGGTLLEGKTEDTEQLAMCYYNLACMISLLYEQNENYQNLDECIYYLRRSFELKRSRVKRAMADSDLDSIRDTIEFKDLINQFSDDSVY